MSTESSNGRRVATLVVKTLMFTMVVPGLVIVFIPSRIAGVPPAVPPRPFTAWQSLGAVLVLVGVGLYLTCAWDFVRVGRGTPAPFAPPRDLVVGGLYRHVRNPMYVGGLTALVGEAMLFRLWALVAYACAVWLMFHLFVVYHEERALRRSFTASYGRYCASVHRWMPRWRPYDGSSNGAAS